MKIELELTEDQYEVLLSLVFSKFDELDKQEDSLLACLNFCAETDEFKKQLLELEKPLENAKNLHKQVASYTML